MAQTIDQNLKNEPVNAEIVALKQLLANSDYKALKHADGEISDEEYAAIKAQRQSWRDKINELQAQLGEDAEA